MKIVPAYSPVGLYVSSIYHEKGPFFEVIQIGGEQEVAQVRLGKLNLKGLGCPKRRKLRNRPAHVEVDGSVNFHMCRSLSLLRHCLDNPSLFGNFSNLENTSSDPPAPGERHIPLPGSDFADGAYREYSSGGF